LPIIILGSDTINGFSIFFTQDHLSQRTCPPNDSRFTCAAKRSGAASGGSACWAARLQGWDKLYQRHQ
ncbi:MAG: hypothetical protein QXS54_10050, partial [Candidatus Methanomethylicaceae archaeon]